MNSGTNSTVGSPQPNPNLSDCTGTRPKFRFPPPPRLSKSVNASSHSDSSSSNTLYIRKRRNKKAKLPPLGIFWDIENCQVPKSKSAAAVVARIREFFLVNYREAEFIVVCDVKKERPQVIQELHDSQVNLIHVEAISKNAADEKLRQSLRRFAEVHKPPSCVVLISGDVNFAADLSDLRYRKKVRVILVHNNCASEALVFCANQRYSYEDMTDGLPVERGKTAPGEFAYIMVSNLPHISPALIKNRLGYIASNCGGKVMEIVLEKGIAYMRFINQDYADRAKLRIQGEDVYGNKIKVVTTSRRNFTGRKGKGIDNQFQASARGLDSDRRQPQDLRGAALSPKGRRPRTPQESFSSVLPGGSRVQCISGSSEFSDDSTESSTKSSTPVNLTISNLDPSISIKELRNLLTNLLKEYVMILSLSVIVQTDGSPIANVKVNSQQEAQFAISQLHRQKLGNKRLVFSYAQNNLPDPEQLRAMVIGLLQEVPEKRMPLFKFIGLLESRYQCTVSVSEVNKLKDTCKITDDLGVRIISLGQEVNSSPFSNLSKTLVPYCTIHCPNGFQNRGWCELSTVQMPNIMVSLKLFTTKMHGLLNMHFGCMPLLSFQICYEQEFREPLSVDVNGVQLEHLISCVPNVEIKTSGPTKNIKIIKQKATMLELDDEAALKSVPPSLAPSISLLCRELVDLLKTTEKCQLLMSKFIPAYHHHFGRQCHVADYGYTKLVDLFESISHVVQIMGDSSRRVITLSHSAQMRRFTSDLLRVLKAQPNKQISLIDYPGAHEKVMNKPFNAVDYGLCTFEDLLNEVPDNTIMINPNGDNFIIGVPKREQTAEEMIRTKQFAIEVIDILRHSPYCSMLFNKFIPAYHHHFGHQCKVSNYGFSKLIELFEAIPDVVKIKELADDERAVSLTVQQSIKILGQQIKLLVKNTTNTSLPFDDLTQVYLREYGYPLKPEMYECESVPNLIEKLSDYVQVAPSNAGLILVSVDTDLVPLLKIRTWALLVNPPYCKDFATFKYEYQARYNTVLSLINLQQLRNVVALTFANDVNYIALTDLYVLAARLYHILHNNNGSLLYNDLERVYFQNFGKSLKLADFQIYSVEELYEKFDFLFFPSVYNRRNVLTLNKNLADYQIAVPPFQCASKKRENQWPPPLHKVIPNSLKKVSPPKPDTPPTPDTAPWSHWGTNSPFNSNLNLSIKLPIMHNPQLLGDPNTLISPAKHLVPNIRNLWDKGAKIEAPDPAELPMPDKLMKGGVSDDSTDSGVNSKLDNSPSDNDEPLGVAVRKYTGVQSRYAPFF